MTEVRLEHANVTVSDPERTAKMLKDIFDWDVRWQGTSDIGGRTVHVGGTSSYLALYQQEGAAKSKENSYATFGGLNHLAVVVGDLEVMDERVRAAGYTPGEHHDYEPGRRFYFHDHDNIEFEVVWYP
jgi:catechol 2,3-dioxygenase-like lactoylglutathione lyase family enzyme